MPCLKFCSFEGFLFYTIQGHSLSQLSHSILPPEWASMSQSHLYTRLDVFLCQATVEIIGKSEVPIKGNECVANVPYISLPAGGGILLDMSKFMAC